MKEFHLNHVALYTKGHYAKNEDIWEDIKACLRADDYTPETKENVLAIVTRNVAPLFKQDIVDYTRALIDAINPYGCWKYGYYTNTCDWIKNYKELKDYDQQEAILWFFLSKLQGSTNTELNNLVRVRADSKVLPLAKKKKQVKL